jgi:hypothetical protein
MQWMIKHMDQVAYEQWEYPRQTQVTKEAEWEAREADEATKAERRRKRLAEKSTDKTDVPADNLEDRTERLSEEIQDSDDSDDQEFADPFEAMLGMRTEQIIDTMVKMRQDADKRSQA